MRLFQSAVAALLVFCSMVGSTMVIPVVRPLFAALHHGAEGPTHAFMSVNMLGAAVGAPLLGLAADRWGHRRLLVLVLCLVDGLLLWMCSLPLPLGLVMVARTVQGAANVGNLSILMGALGRIHRKERGNGSVGLLGAATIAAVAAGAPLGTWLMGMGVAVPLQVGAALAVAVGVCAPWFLPAQVAPSSGPRNLPALLRQHRGLRLPAMWMGVERFTVGCFVVTFSLYAHHVLGLDDQRTGTLYSMMLLPFALLTWPMGLLAARAGPRGLLYAGAAVYGAAFLGLALTPPGVFPMLLVCAGVASAALYAGALYAGAQAAPEALRVSAMAVLNAGGTLGMLAGTAGAGVASALMQRAGLERAVVYPTILAAAGVGVWLMLLTLMRRGAPLGGASSTMPQAAPTGAPTRGGTL